MIPIPLQRDDAPLTRRAAAILGSLVLAGAALRLFLAATHPYYDDECGTLFFICAPVDQILGHFGSWLTMNWFILLEKGIADVFGEGFLAMRAVSVAAGVALIPMTAAVARRLGAGEISALLAAGLVAGNFFLVQFGMTARSYSLLTYLAMAILWNFLRWREDPGWLRCIVLGLLSCAAILSHLNGAFVVCWLVAACGIDLISSLSDAQKRNRCLTGLQRLAVPLILGAGAAAFYYFTLRDDIAYFRGAWARPSLGPVDYVPAAFCLFMSSEWIAWPFAGLLAIGIAALYRRNRTGLMWALLWIILPVCGASLAGYVHYFWGMARFHIFTLPVIMILCGTGAGWILSRLTRRSAAWIVVPAALACTLIWIADVAAFHREGLKKPYHEVARFCLERDGGRGLVKGLSKDVAVRVHPYLDCARRLAISPGSHRNTLVADLLEGARSTAFLVMHSAHIPEFDGLEIREFGEVRVAVFPPERHGDRLRRLFSSFEAAAAAIPEGHLCEDCTDVYRPLADMYAIRSNAPRAAEYGELAARSRALHPHIIHAPGRRSPATEDAKPESSGREEIVLFDGTDLTAWTTPSGVQPGWKITGDAMAVVPGKGSIMTRDVYGDFELHLEFKVPVKEAPSDGKNRDNGDRGDRGNSGVYLQRRYEVQILDSHGVNITNWDCGALYRQRVPDVNASRPAGEWQSFDIVFRAARFSGTLKDAVKTANARITVVHNGVVIHDDVELTGKTGQGLPEGPGDGPILLQDHGSAVMFRNIRIVPLQPQG